MGNVLRRAVLVFALACGCALPARADDLKLKDGSKINGTIVGFDDSSFKVQTSYGFALVRKDQVVSITMSNAAKPTAGNASNGSTGEKDKKAPSQSLSAASPSDQPDKSGPVSGRTAQTLLSESAQPSVGNTTAAVTGSSAPAAPAPVSLVPAPPTVTAAPPTPVPPTPIRENVAGNLYTNETYGFQMYKPPSWQVIAGAQSLLPGAIAAMGTIDQTTYLLIGREPAGKSVASDINATDERLRSLMDNFRPQGESQVKVSGTTAVEQRFRGGVDQRDWSGTVVFLPRGGVLYTIFGMTVADTDLVQIQENVIERSISSLHFAQ